MTLALFDLDNTLLNGDSDHAWGEFLVTQGIVDEQQYRNTNDRFYQDYQQGQLDIDAYLRFALEPLTRFNLTQLQALHGQFMEQVIEPMLQQKAFDLLQTHRDQGHYLMIITATNLFVTEPIGKRLGVDEILATTPEIINQRYTGNIEGTACFQQGKVTRLQNWLQQSGNNLQGSYFYSDSINDLPLLQQVDHPIAVDPCERLRNAAIDHNWPIISLQDSPSP